jgi:acyl-CoA synthetase (NDP forming)
MAADTAQDLGLTLATLDSQTVDAVAASLPAFATTTNPIDLTAALLHDSHILGKVLPPLAERASADLFCVDLPVTGEGYDIDVIAGDAARFAARSGSPVVAVSPQPASAAIFRAAGIPTFENPTEALGALTELADHVRLMQRQRGSATVRRVRTRPITEGRWLNEHESLALLAEQGLPIVPHRLCRSAAEARAAFAEFGPLVAVKACSRDVPHKGDKGLVALNVNTAEEVARVYAAQLAILGKIGARADGVIVATMVSGLCEVALGITWDAVFGPLVMVAAGGRDIEALNEAVLVVPPFSAEDVKDALTRLERSRLLVARDGARTPDVDALCEVAIRLGEMALGADGIQSIDVNPVLVGEAGAGVTIVDALVELAGAEAAQERA